MNVKMELYEAFSPPEPKRKEIFLNSLPYPGLNFSQFVFSQIKYIRKRVWVVSVLIVAAAICTVCFMSLKNPSYIELPAVWIISSLTPFLAMLTASEISRSNMYGMTELETACRFSLPQLTGARTLILGTVSFAVIAALTLISGIFTPVGIANAAIYILTPFLLVNGVSLAIFSHFKGKEGGYISGAAALFVSVWGILLQGSQVEIPENICNNFCILLCIFGTAAIILNMKKISNGANYYGTHT
ncbi:MAG: hypothetical protein ACI4J0_00015 [Huintestinicola sp.]|uniref:hypothetical protein n=1 Tax=Huintestinicola sp. TaxID=2981661 RepID=UPI003F07E299